MIKIQLEKGTLDIPSGVEISLSHTPYRFAVSMQDEWTNDFTVPATRDNIAILDAQGLLYANNQRYGSEIKPCTLTLNGEMMNARVQVVSMSKDEIQLCLYVSRVPEAIKGETIRDFFVDDESTIIPWHRNSTNKYPAWFPTYWYGMTYNAQAAQKHPAKSLNSILMALQNKTGITIQMPSKNYYALAQHKKVCPQNTKQVLLAKYTDDMSVVRRLDVIGGQHITNDISSQSERIITFNRKCKVHIEWMLSWQNRNSDVQTYYWAAQIITKKIGQEERFDTRFVLPVADYYSKVQVFEADIELDEGEQLSFGVTAAEFFRICNAEIVLTITDYNISDDDYEQELEYIPDFQGAEIPHLIERTDTQIGYDCVTRPLSQYRTEYVDWNRNPYSYFGFWANIENCKITDLLYNIAFLEGKEAIYDAFSNEINFALANRIKELKTAEIVEYRPTTDKFAQKNFITFKGQATDKIVPLTTIDSVYLEDEKTLKESIFCINHLHTNNGKEYGSIEQYSNPEYDADSQKYTCDFEDVEGFCLLRATEHNGQTYLNPITLNTNGLEKITSVMEVKMLDRLGTDLSKTDYVYVNGVKIMLTNVNSTLNPNSNENEITGIVVPEQF